MTARTTAATKIREEFMPMRSCAPDPKHPMVFPGYMSPKYDGIRLCKWEGNVYTKSKKRLKNNMIHEWVMANIPDRLDFEIVVGDPASNETYANTYKLCSTIKATGPFKLYVLDYIDQGVEVSVRMQRLQHLLATLPDDVLQYIVVAPQTYITDQEGYDNAHAANLDAGFEGSIYKPSRGWYKFGKCTPLEYNQFKLKPEEDRDCEILGITEAMFNGNEAFTNEMGHTARSSHQENKVGKGMCGGFPARDVETGVVFDLAPGKMTHAQRIEAWLNKEKYFPGCGIFAKYRTQVYGTIDKPRQNRWYSWRDSADTDNVKVASDD
jgi:DNA ligase-1